MVEYRGFECHFRDIYNTDNHVYVYEIKDNRVIYERTVGCEASAIDRIIELRKRGSNGVYTVGATIIGSYY
jgi:hypothetical protein